VTSFAALLLIVLIDVVVWVIAFLRCTGHGLSLRLIEANVAVIASNTALIVILEADKWARTVGG
jgi:hypothetical protein